MTAVRLARPRGLCNRGWSMAALSLCLLASAASFAVASSSGQGAADWRWWLLVLPVGACLAAVLVPVRTVMIGASIVVIGLIVVGAASIGWFFVPTAAALIMGVGRGQQP